MEREGSLYVLKCQPPVSTWNSIEKTFCPYHESNPGSVHRLLLY